MQSKVTLHEMPDKLFALLEAELTGGVLLPKEVDQVAGFDDEDDGFDFDDDEEEDDDFFEDEDEDEDGEEDDEDDDFFDDDDDPQWRSGPCRLQLPGP